MNKNKNKAVSSILEHIRLEGGGGITYKFADGSVQMQPIQPSIFRTEKNTFVPVTEIIKIFNTTMIDLGAVDYIISP